MRSQQQPAPQGAVNYNAGINMLPGMMPDDYAPLTGASDFRPLPQQSFVAPAPSAPPIPRAQPVNDWRGSAVGVPGVNTRPAPGTPSTSEPLPFDDTWFVKDWFKALFGGLGNVAGSVAGGIGNMASNAGEDDGLAGFFRRMAEPRAPRIGGGPLGAVPRGAFSATSFQQHFPGSLIGPTSGLRTNPYSASMGPLGGQQQMGGPPPAGAQAFMNTVRARNIA